MAQCWPFVPLHVFCWTLVRSAVPPSATSRHLLLTTARSSYTLSDTSITCQRWAFVPLHLYCCTLAPSAVDAFATSTHSPDVVPVRI